MGPCTYSPRADRKICENCGKRPVKTHNRNLCPYCQKKGETEPTGITWRTFARYSDAGKERFSG